MATSLSLPENRLAVLGNHQPPWTTHDKALADSQKPQYSRTHAPVDLSCIRRSPKKATLLPLLASSQQSHDARPQTYGASQTTGSHDLSTTDGGLEPGRNAFETPMDPRKAYEILGLTGEKEENHYVVSTMYVHRIQNDPANLNLYQEALDVLMKNFKHPTKIRYSNHHKLTNLNRTTNLNPNWIFDAQGRVLQHSRTASRSGIPGSEPWTQEMDKILRENARRREQIAEFYLNNQKSGDAGRQRYARVQLDRSVQNFLTGRDSSARTLFDVDRVMPVLSPSEAAAEDQTDTARYGQERAPDQNPSTKQHGLGLLVDSPKMTERTVHYTISEDRTGNRDEVCRKLLAPQNQLLVTRIFALTITPTGKIHCKISEQ